MERKKMRVKRGAAELSLLRSVTSAAALDALGLSATLLPVSVLTTDRTPSEGTSIQGQGAACRVALFKTFWDSSWTDIARRLRQTLRSGE